jgi:hypothetical protein
MVEDQRGRLIDDLYELPSLVTAIRTGLEVGPAHRTSTQIEPCERGVSSCDLAGRTPDDLKLRVVPRLILINGPPACGKSTMARMYADGHPLALVLDVDQVRGCLGRWRKDLPSAGAPRGRSRWPRLAPPARRARRGPARLLGRPDFLTGLERAARGAGAGFAEIILMARTTCCARSLIARPWPSLPASPP